MVINGSGIRDDEQCSFVGAKLTPRWLWYAVEHATNTVLAYVFGRRQDVVFKSLKRQSLPRAGHLTLLTIVFLVTSSFSAGANGQQVGDDCSNPIAAMIGVNSFNTSNFAASDIPIESGRCVYLSEMDWDIWFSHTFAQDGLAKVSTCSPDTNDTNLTVFQATDSCQSLSTVFNGGDAEPDGSCDGEQSENIFVVTAGTEYLIRLAGDNDDTSAGAASTLNLTFKQHANSSGAPPDCSSTFVAHNPFTIPDPIKFDTDGMFAIWWDGDFNHSRETQSVFDRLASVRADALNNFNMEDPPNPGQCFYYNVYVHHGDEDDFPPGWSTGQGTDDYCRPYLTFFSRTHLDESNIYHEGFHIFQYSADSPGFSGDDYDWYVEATAQWYMATKMPDDDDDDAFIEAGTIVANPQLALWHAFYNGAPGDPEPHGSWFYGIRQYGMNTLLFYLTEIRGVESNHITDGFYNGTELLPQEYLHSAIGGERFRQLFADWAAENTAGLTYLKPDQVQAAWAEAEIARADEPQYFKPYVADVSASALENGWAWQACPQRACYRPRSWAYNVIRIANETAGEYVFKLDGNPNGSEGAASHFESRIVIMQPGGSPRIETMNMADTRDGEHSIFVNADVSEVFVVIVSAPDHFTGNQTYGYNLSASFDPGAVPPTVPVQGLGLLAMLIAGLGWLGLHRCRQAKAK